MDHEELKRQDRRQRETEHQQFLDLFWDHPLVLNLDAAPTGSGPDLDDQYSRVAALHAAAFASPYLKRLRLDAVRRVIDDLETHRSSPAGSDMELRPANTASELEFERKRRALCFLHRFAHIVKWRGFEHRPPNTEALTRERKAIARKCFELKALLVDQLDDQYLLEALPGDSLDKLAGFIRDVARFGDAFATVKPSMPYARNRDEENTVMRILVHALAVCCYRVYQHCSPEILRKLLKATWLERYASPRKKVFDKLIEDALARKISDYEERNAPAPAAAPHPIIPWMPPRHL